MKDLWTGIWICAVVKFTMDLVIYFEDKKKRKY